MMKHTRWPLVVVAMLAVLLPGVIRGETPPVEFPQGVASGDVTGTSAVLWTRADQGITLKLEVSTNSSFEG